MKTLKLEDLESVCELVSDLKKTFPELKSQGFNWTDESLQSELSVGRGVGIWSENVLSAFILFRSVGDALEITLLCTHPLNQRCGLMEGLFNEFRTANPEKEIWLEVHENNSKALNFYKKIGFKETGRRPGYYRDGAAALLMSYPL